MSEHFNPHKNKINEPLDNVNTSKKIRTYENKWFDHNSSNTSLDRNLNDTASTSRYGRTRKPKISEDYYNIEDIFAPYEKIINRKKPQLDLKSTTNSVTLSSEDEIMDIFSNDLPEENLEVSKVLKIVSNKPTTDFSERSPSSSAKPLKTYVNKNRLPSTKVVESFALPDYDNVLNPPSNYMEIYPKKDLTNCTPTKNPLKSITSSNMSNNASIKLSENIKNPSDICKNHDKSTDIAEKPDTTDNISNPSENSNSDIDPSELTLNELSIYLKDPSKFRRKRLEEDENEPLDKIKKRIQKTDTSDLNVKLNKNQVTENKNKTTVKVTANKLKIIGRQQKRKHGVVKRPIFKKNKIYLNEIIKDLNTYSDVEESGSKFDIDMTYKPEIGSLAWARVGSYPFWPAIVSKEPGKDYFTKDKIFGMKPKCFYHVNFFGDNGRRSWVLATHLFPFRSMKDMEEMAKFVSDKVKPKDPQHISAFIIHPGRVQKWERAVTEAQSLLKYPIERRVKRFFDLLKKAANKPKTISESSSKHVSETETVPTKSKKDSLDEESAEKSPRKFTDLNGQPLKIAMKFRKISTDSDATTKSASKSSKSSVEAELQQSPVRKISEKIEEKDTIEAPKKLNTSSEIIETRLKNAAKRKFRSGSPKIVDEKPGDFVIDQLEIEEKLPKVDVPENNSPVSIQSQTSKSKKFSLFRGVTKERVCQICGLPKKVVKCSGNCFGLFHVECDRLLFEKVQKQTKESPESDQFQSKQQTEKAIPKKMTTKTKSQRKFLKKQEQKLLMDSQLKNSPREGTSDEKTTPDESRNKNEVAIDCIPTKLNQETIKPEEDNVKNEEKPLGDIENKVFENDKNMEVDELNLKVLHEIAVKIKSDVRDEMRGNPNELKKEELKKNLQESGMKNLSITDGMDAILSEVMKDSMLAKYEYDSDELSDAGSMFEPETAETTTEDILKKNEIVPASNMRIIKHVTADGVYDIVQNVAPVETEKKSNESFKCTYCRLDMIPPCFVCGKINKFGDSILHRCQTFHCGKYYHESCLSAWPQAKWHLVTRGKQTYNENLCCPYHNCHTCISDDPRAPLARSASEKLAKCIKCPTTYHRSSYCIPAGTEILSSHQIICPKHWAGDKLENGKKIVQHINTSWCFICSIGGSLICCETCPSSFHVECLKLVPPEGRYFCEECESGRLPLYGEIIWAKLGAYRWWPGRILFPYEIPENVKSKKHRQGEFVVRFFGTHDHYWVNRGRVFIFQEGDNGNVSTTKKNTFNGVFIKAVQEAKMAHKNFLEERENRTTDQDVGLKPPPYIKIKSNRPVGDVRYNDGDTSNTTACECDPNSEAPCGPDSDCLNRILLTECNPAVCRAGTRCCNQAFEKREYARVQPFRTGGSNGGSGGRGWGLRTLQPIARGSFVIEYVGEIINEPEYRRRLHRKHQQKDENYYFLTIDKDRMIDAGPKGNEARFMNHSCTPNCVTQKWTVNGDTRVGLFAIEDIPTGAELTFNYNLECIGEEKKVCRCGSANCSGFIGLKVKQEENGKRKKSLSKPKKKKSVDGKPEELTDICLKCKKVGATQYCDRDECNRCYHLECVNLTEEPTGKWICPVHFCNVCSKRSSNFCKLCPNSFCKLHSTQKIAHMWLKAYLCEDHTESEIEELKEKLTKSKSSFNARDLRVQQRNKIRSKWENDSFKLSPKRKLHKTRAGKKKLKVSLIKLKPKLKQRSPIKKSKKDKNVSKVNKSWSNSTDDDENTKPLAKIARHSKKIEKKVEKGVQKIEADKDKKVEDENINSEKETVEDNKKETTKNIEAKIETNSDSCQTTLDSQNLDETKTDTSKNQEDDEEIVRETNKIIQEPTDITVTSKLDEKPSLVRRQNLEKTSNKYSQKGGQKVLDQKVSVNILKADKNLAEKYLKTNKPSPKKNLVKSRIVRNDTGKKTSEIDEIKDTEKHVKTTEIKSTVNDNSNLPSNSSSGENSPVTQTSSRITENIGVNLKITNPKLAEKIVKTLTKKLDEPVTEKEIKNRPGTIQEKILSCTKRNDIIKDIKNDDFCNLISSTPKRIPDDKLNIQTSDVSNHVEKSFTSFNSSLSKVTCQNTNLNDSEQTSTKEPESSRDSNDTLQAESTKIRSVSTSLNQTNMLSSKRKVYEIESSSDDDSSKPLIMLTKRQKIQIKSPKLSKFSKLTLKKLTSPESPTKAYKTLERPSSARPTRSNTKAPDIKIDEVKLRMRKRKIIENMMQEKKLTDSESELSDSKYELDSIFNKKHPLKTWIDSSKTDSKELEDTLKAQEIQLDVEDNIKSRQKEEIMEENKNIQQQNINPSTKITTTDNFDTSSNKNISPSKLQESTIKTNTTLPEKTDDSQSISTNKKQITLKNITEDKNINISEEPTKTVSPSKISKCITPLPQTNIDREQKTTNLKETSKILQEKNITVEKELVSDENNTKLDEKTTDLERKGEDFDEKCLDLQAKCMGLEAKQPVVVKHIDSDEKLIEEKPVECLKEKTPNLEEKVLVVEEKHLDSEEKHLDLEEKHLDLEEKHLSLQEKHLGLEEKHLGLEEKHLDLGENRIDSNKNSQSIEEKPKSMESKQKDLEEIQKGLEEEHKALEEEQKALEEQKCLKEKHEGLEEKYKDFEGTGTKCEEKHTDLDIKPIYEQEKLKYLLEKTKILEENTTKLEEKSTDLGEHCKDLLEKPTDLKENKNLQEKSTKLTDIPRCSTEKFIEPEEKPIKLENTCLDERRKHSEICTQETNTSSIKMSEKLTENVTDLKKQTKNLNENVTELQVKQNIKNVEEKNISEEKSTNLELRNKKIDLEEPNTNLNKKCKYKNVNLEENGMGLKENCAVSKEKEDLKDISNKEKIVCLKNISADFVQPITFSKAQDKSLDSDEVNKGNDLKIKQISSELEQSNTSLLEKSTIVKEKITTLEEKFTNLEEKSKNLEEKSKNLEEQSKNLTEKSKKLKEKSENLEEKSKKLEEKSTNLEKKFTNLEEKSTNLEEKSSDSIEKSTNLEDKSKSLDQKSRSFDENSIKLETNSKNSEEKPITIDINSIDIEDEFAHLAEISSDDKEKPINLEEKSTHSGKKLTNLKRKCTDLGEKSTSPKSKSVSLEKKSTSLTDKTTNVKGKYTNLQEKSSHLGERSLNLKRKTNLENKCTNLAEKTTNSVEKSTNLAEKSTNLVEKSTNLAEKPTNLLGKSTNLAGRSTNSSEKCTYLAGKSTNLIEKSTNLLEKSTEAAGKSTKLAGKSTNSVEKSTNLLENPTNLIEKATSFKEKLKNLKEKCSDSGEKPAYLEKKCTDFQEKSRNMDAKSTNFEEKSTNIDAKSTNVDESSINLDVKSTNLKEKSKKPANLETKCRSLEENPKNLRSKLKSFEEKSVNMETKSANSRKRGVNSQEKIKVKSDEKGTKLKEESGNLEDKPTNLKDKSNSEEKTSNLEVESINLEGKSTNLKNKSKNLEDNSANLKDKPTNLKDKPTNLKDKHTNLKYKPTNLKDMPTNLKDKTTNLEQKPENLKDISTNLENTSKNLEDLSRNMQGKSTNLKDKSTYLEDSSTNVDKKCMDSQEKTTNSNNKLMSLAEKSTNLEEKLTSLEEKPTALEEKPTNFEEKRKNLKEKRTSGRVLDISSSDTTDLNPKLESSSAQNVHSLSIKSLEETKISSNIETISESSSIDSANKTQSDVKNGMSVIEKDIQPDSEISVSETKNLFDKIDTKELKKQVPSRATPVRKSGRISSPEVSKISQLPEPNSPKTTPRSEKRHKKIQLGIRKSQRNLQRHPNDIFTNSSELSSPTTPKQIKLSESTPHSSKTAEKTLKSTEENQTLKSLKSPINAVSTGSPKLSLILTETQESTPSKKRKRSLSEDSDSSNRVFKKLSQAQDAKLTLKSSPKVAISRLDTSKLSSSQISVLKKQETSKNVIDSGRETPRSFNTRQEITRNVVTRQETPKSVHVRQETPKTVNTKQETTGKSVNIRQETTGKNINTRQETVTSKSSNSRQETPKGKNSLQGTPTAKSGNSRQESTPKGASSRPETTPKGVSSRQETTPKTGNSRQETTLKQVNTRQGTPTPKGVNVRQEVSRVVLSRQEATPKSVISRQETSTPKTARQDTPTRSSRQVSTKNLTPQQDTTKNIETPKSSSSRNDSLKSSPSGSSTSIAKTETPKTPQVLRSDGSRKWLLRYDSVQYTTPKLDSLKSSTSKPDISKASPSRMDSSKLSLSKHDTTKPSNPRIEPSKNLNVKDGSKVVCVRLNNKDATKSTPSTEIPSTSFAQNERKRTRETRSTSSKAPEIINDRYKEILQRDSIVTVPEVKLSSTIPARHLRVILNKNIGIDTKNDHRFIEMQNELEKDLPIRKRSKLRLEL